MSVVRGILDLIMGSPYECCGLDTDVWSSKNSCERKIILHCIAT